MIFILNYPNAYSQAMIFFRVYFFQIIEVKYKMWFLEISTLSVYKNENTFFEIVLWGKNLIPNNHRTIETKYI